MVRQRWQRSSSARRSLMEINTTARPQRLHGKSFRKNQYKSYRMTHYPNTMHVSKIDTPALVVDLDILERNLARVAAYAREHDLRLRPHTKTHKSVRLARRQIA